MSKPFCRRRSTSIGCRLRAMRHRACGPDNSMIFIGGGVPVWGRYSAPYMRPDGHRPQVTFYYRSPYTAKKDLFYLDKMQGNFESAYPGVRFHLTLSDARRTDAGQSRTDHERSSRSPGDLTGAYLWLAPRRWSTPPLSYFRQRRW